MSAPALSRNSTPNTTSTLEVSRYDQVAGSLVSVLIVMGVLTFAMFLLWVATRTIRVQTAVPIKPLEDVGGGGFGDTLLPGMQQREFFEPTSEELPLPQTMDTPNVASIADSLAAVSTVVSGEAQTLDYLEGPSVGSGRGEGEGMGDGRGKGPGGPGTSDGIPAWERWEVRVSAERIEDYKRYLDFFGVEIGVAGGGSPNVDYLKDFTKGKGTKRVGLPKDERRLRFMHRSGQLREADRQLAAEAGIPTAGRVVFQFYSKQMYDQLLTLENARMGSHRIIQVRRTVFGVKTVGQRFEFYVISQEYRPGV